MTVSHNAEHARAVWASVKQYQDKTDMENTELAASVAYAENWANDGIALQANSHPEDLTEAAIERAMAKLGKLEVSPVVAGGWQPSKTPFGLAQYKPEGGVIGVRPVTGPFELYAELMKERKLLAQAEAAYVSLRGVIEMLQQELVDMRKAEADRKQAAINERHERAKVEAKLDQEYDCAKRGGFALAGALERADNAKVKHGTPLFDRYY